MGFFKKIKESTSEKFGNEKIGEIDKTREKKKGTKKKKPKKGKSKKEKKSFFNKKEKNIDDFIKTENTPTSQKQINHINTVEQEDDDYSKYIKTDKAGGRSRSMVLNQLGVREGVIIPDGLITPEAIDNVEFTMVVPSGLDPDEVAEFCNVLERGVTDYRNELKTIHNEKEKLIDEILRIETQIIEQRNQEALNAFITQGNDVKDKLQNDLVDIQMKYTELKQKNEVLQARIKKREESGIDPDVLEENHQLKNSIKKLEAKLVKLENSDTQVISAEVETKLTALEQENKELENELNEYKQSQETINQLTEQNQKLQRELEKLLNKESETIKNDQMSVTSPTAEVKPDEKPKIIEKTFDNSKDIEEKNYQTSAEPVNNETFSVTELDKESDDYEKMVLEQYLNKNTKKKKNKHIKTKMTPEDIIKKKKAEAQGKVYVKGLNFETPTQTGDPLFDQMMKQMNED